MKKYTLQLDEDDECTTIEAENLLDARRQAEIWGLGSIYARSIEGILARQITICIDEVCLAPSVDEREADTITVANSVEAQQARIDLEHRARKAKHQAQLAARAALLTGYHIDPEALPRSGGRVVWRYDGGKLRDLGNGWIAEDHVLAGTKMYQRD